MNRASVLHTAATARPMLTGWNAKRRRGRAFQRSLTGLQIRGRYRFLTLTTLPGTTPAQLQTYWRRLSSRMGRWNFGEGRIMTGYIRVVERGPETGMLHIHVVFRGQFLDQRVFQWLWEMISGASVVDVRAVRTRKGAAAELAKYMSKDPQARLAYSHSWAWKALGRTWSEWTRHWRRSGQSERLGWALAFFLWRSCARYRAPPHHTDRNQLAWLATRWGVIRPWQPYPAS